MTSATDYRAVSRLVMRQFRPGMHTNNFLTKADYEQQIARQQLQLQEFDGGLLLLTQRDGYTQLRFHLHNAESLPTLPADQPIVCEVVRPTTEDNAADQWLQQLGFAPLLHRIRLVHDAAPAAAVPLDPASAADSDAICHILNRCFDARTGCLPDDGELQTILSEGRILCVRNEAGTPVGLLHFRSARGGTELRHLAVLAEYRGQKLAQNLFAQYLHATGGQKCLIWAREDNAPAQQFYHKCGCRPDGWRATVYEKG